MTKKDENKPKETGLAHIFVKKRTFKNVIITNSLLTRSMCLTCPATVGLITGSTVKLQDRPELVC